jgi:hypothetical protein
MSADAVIGWVPTMAAGPRPSQARTLAELVEAAAHVGRGTLSAIGRCLPRTTTAKHRIGRVWRLCDNDLVHADGVVRRVVRRITRGRRRPLLVAPDWTEIRGFHTLMAAAVMRGRAVPPVGASYTTGQPHRSRNSFEEGLLRLLLTMLPGGAKVILLSTGPRLRVTFRRAATARERLPWTAPSRSRLANNLTDLPGHVPSRAGRLRRRPG